MMPPRRARAGRRKSNTGCSASKLVGVLADSLDRSDFLNDAVSKDAILVNRKLYRQIIEASNGEPPSLTKKLVQQALSLAADEAGKGWQSPITSAVVKRKWVEYVEPRLRRQLKVLRVHFTKYAGSSFARQIMQAGDSDTELEATQLELTRAADAAEDEAAVLAEADALLDADSDLDLDAELEAFIDAEIVEVNSSGDVDPFAPGAIEPSSGSGSGGTRSSSSSGGSSSSEVVVVVPPPPPPPPPLCLSGLQSQSVVAGSSAGSSAHAGGSANGAACVVTPPAGDPGSLDPDHHHHRSVFQIMGVGGAGCGAGCGGRCTVICSIRFDVWWSSVCCRLRACC